MELPHLGTHCSASICKQLDFLPMKCDACENVFCKDHILYHHHECSASYKKDIQVPVCPLCNQPVPGRRDEPPDIRVGEHIDRDCQSDPAKEKRKIYINKCSVKNCKQKEMIKVSCNACNRNYCLKHRHPQDHNCNAPNGRTGISQAGAAALARSKVPPNRPNPVSQPTRHLSQVSNRNIPLSVQIATAQGNLSEDEALARAIALSLDDSSAPTLSQEEEDRRMAEALAASERRQPQRVK